MLSEELTYKIAEQVKTDSAILLIKSTLSAEGMFGILTNTYFVLCVDLFYREIYCHSLVDCGSSQLYLSVCVSVCLSRFYGLYFDYYGLDFDQTW